MPKIKEFVALKVPLTAPPAVAATNGAADVTMEEAQPVAYFPPASNGGGNGDIVV
jgi:hypothetical protein